MKEYEKHQRKADTKVSAGTKTLRLCYLALLISLGLILPSAFHLIGGSAAGSIFLPLHIPVLLAALMLGAGEGLFMGLIMPVLSSLITGMPLPAILPFMVLELSVYGLLCGITMKIFKREGVALSISLIAGRIIYAAALALLLSFSLQVPSFLTVLTSAVKGLPGIIIQLSIIPVLTKVVKKYAFNRNKTAFQKA